MAELPAAWGFSEKDRPDQRRPQDFPLGRNAHSIMGTAGTAKRQSIRPLTESWGPIASTTLAPAAGGKSLRQRSGRRKRSINTPAVEKKWQQQGEKVRAATLTPGIRVSAGDRGNIGEIIADNGNTCIVHFITPEGNHAEKDLPKSQLRAVDSQPLRQPAARRDLLQC